MIGALPGAMGRKLAKDAAKAPHGLAWTERGGWGFAIRESAGLYELFAVPLSDRVMKRPRQATELRDRVAKGAGAKGTPRGFRGAFVWRWTADAEPAPAPVTRTSQADRDRAAAWGRAPRQSAPPRGHGRRRAARKGRRAAKVGSAPALAVWRKVRERHAAGRFMLGDGGGLPPWYTPQPAQLDPGGSIAERADLAYSRAVTALDQAQSNPQGAYERLIGAYRLLWQLQLEAYRDGFDMLGAAILYLAERVGAAAVILGESFGKGAAAFGEGVGKATEAILGGKPYDFWSDAWWMALIGLGVGGALLATGGGQSILYGLGAIPAGYGSAVRSVGKGVGEGAGELIGNFNVLALLGIK